MREHAWFYNFRVGRSPQRLNQELRALWETGPFLLGGCEALGYDLPHLPGATLIRDRSTEGRANIVAYVRNGLPLGEPRWVACDETWPRWHYPGQHWPREILVLPMGKLQSVIGHAPPRPIPKSNTAKARTEHVVKLSRIMNPRLRDDWKDRTITSKLYAIKRKRMLLWDANLKPGEEGPGPDWLAAKIHGSVHGNRIDCADVRNIRVHGWSYHSRVNGVEMQSDHGHAFRLDVAAGTV